MYASASRTTLGFLIEKFICLLIGNVKGYATIYLDLGMAMFVSFVRMSYRIALNFAASSSKSEASKASPSSINRSVFSKYLEHFEKSVTY